MTQSPNMLPRYTITLVLSNNGMSKMKKSSFSKLDSERLLWSVMLLETVLVSVVYCLWQCWSPRFMWISMVLQQARTELMSLAWVTTEGHLGVLVLCCCLKSSWCPRTGLLPGTILMWVARTATWGHGDARILADTKGHVWTRGPITARVYVAVHDLSYHQRLWGFS